MENRVRSQPHQRQHLNFQCKSSTTNCHVCKGEIHLQYTSNHIVRSWSKIQNRSQREFSVKLNRSWIRFKNKNKPHNKATSVYPNIQYNLICWRSCIAVLSISLWHVINGLINMHTILNLVQPNALFLNSVCSTMIFFFFKDKTTWIFVAFVKYSVSVTWLYLKRRKILGFYFIIC